MTVKARIALGIAALLIVIAMLGGVAVWFFDGIAQSVNAAAGPAYARLDRAQDLSFEAASLHGRVSEGASGGALSERRAGFAERLTAGVGALFEQPASEVDSLVIKDLLAEASRLSELNEAYQTSLGEGPAGDDTVREAELESVLAEITRLLAGVYAHNASLLEREIALASDRAGRGFRYTGIFLAMCVAFSVAVLIWLPRYVAQPINDFGESISRITAGNYRTRLRVDRRDEFGRLAVAFNRMAAELEAGSTESQAAVLESQARLMALVDQLDELILGMDAGRVIVFINAAMAAYLDVDADEVLGEYMPDLALGRPRVQQLFRPIALGQQATSEPFAVDDADGTQRYLQQRVIRLREPEGGQEGDYIVLVTDVTDFEQRNHEQTDFLAAVSHEMKTPIAAINMSIGLLEDTRLGHLDEDQRELTATVRKNAARLFRMVDEVLSLSESEAGAAKLQLEQLDVNALVAEVRDSVAPLAEGKAVRLAFELPPEAYRIEGDRERIGSAVTNLLTNAIRYVPVGGEVALRMTVVSGGVRIEVTDDGPGVRPEDRERIFGRYKRGTDDATAGTGLGLAISRESVEAHGGRLYVDAAYGPGARFVLELPRRLAQVRRARQLAAG